MLTRQLRQRLDAEDYPVHGRGGGFWSGGVIVPALANYDLCLPLVLN
jgi:hypothetical protein